MYNTSFSNAQTNYRQEDVIEEIVAETRGKQTRPNSNGGYDLCDCPVCGGHGNLSVDPGDDGFPIIYCHSGCTPKGCKPNPVIEELIARGIEFWPKRGPKEHVSPEERQRRREAAARRQEQRAKEKARLEQEAAEKAKEIYEAASGDNVASHPYAKKKRLSFGPGVRRGAWPQRGWTDALLIPLCDVDGNMTSLQAINVDGKKDYLEGGRKRGSSYLLGEPPDTGGIIYIGEGIATVAAVRHVTGHPVRSVCDCGNLQPVAEAERRRRPTTKIIILEDNDINSKAGPKKALQAALAVNGKVARAADGIAGLKDGGDFWDVWNEGGDEAVLDALNRAREPETDKSGDASKSEGDEIGEGDGGDEAKPSAKPGRPSAAAELVALARERCVFFHDENGDGYAEIRLDDRRECLPLKSKSFMEWLCSEQYRRGGVALEKNVKAAIDTLSGAARFDGEERSVHLRVARHDDAYWIDLCDEQWRAVRVTADGWSIEAEPPVMFVRNPNMRPLPEPERGGDVALLWEVTNIRESDQPTVLAWMVECFRPDTPYPILELTGFQGSAKSATQNILRELIDPNKANLRTAPGTAENFFVSARNAHMVSLNNLSRLTPEMQDALCSLSTGGGFGTRTLYTTGDETVVNVQRPVILNGIGAVITAQDLVDRTIPIDLPVIPAQNRRLESDLALHFAKIRGAIFGGLMDLFARTLALLPSVQKPAGGLPRMADFALFGEAVCRALGRQEGEFLAGYEDRRTENILQTLEGHPTFVACRDYLTENPFGIESMPIGEMRKALLGKAPDGMPFPRSGKGLGDAIRRLGPSMSLVGIDAGPVLDEQGRQKRSRDGYHYFLRQSADLPEAGSL